MTKVTIISGFLGAGKTTFIRKLIEIHVIQPRQQIQKEADPPAGIDNSQLCHSKSILECFSTANKSCSMAEISSRNTSYICQFLTTATSPTLRKRLSLTETS